MEYGGSSYVDLSLCLAACIVSAPLNAMSPSLSTVAYEFHFSERERDLYLASYLSLLSMFGQLAGSVFTGFVGDYFTRRNLVLIALIVSGISCLSFSFSMTYSGLAVSRLAMGFSQGSAIPAFFSILGDSHKPESRPGISALVSSSLGGGMMLGQLFAGYVLSIIGWRNTFIVIAFITLVTFCIVHYLLKEPERGLNEGDLSTYILSGKSLPKMTMDTFVFNIMIPSIFLLIVQTIPNTIPWGVLSTHLHDLLATDLHLTMEEATAMIAIFGVGAAAGGLSGGFIGSKLYIRKKNALPLFMGATLILSAFLLKGLLGINMQNQGALQLAYPVLILVGAFAAINGANIRSLVLNLTSPEARTAVIAFLNVVNCVGRGIGPAVMEFYIDYFGASRLESMIMILNLWSIAGLMICLVGVTIVRDEESMKNNIMNIVSGLPLLY